MRKVFPLEKPGIKPPLVVAAIKNEVRKYLKRERRKELPEGVDYWDFDCQVGRDRTSPKVAKTAGLIDAVDTAAQENWGSIYIEILAKPGYRSSKATDDEGG
jgi:hypothetical protein